MLARRLLLRTPRRLNLSTLASVYYQGDGVPRSIYSTGRVGTDRDAQGSDGEFFGVSPTPTEVPIADGRARAFTLDENGMCLVDHAWDHIDYYDNDATLSTYYPEVERLVRQQTGASRVLAFDHNLRAKARLLTQLQGDGGNAVQAPLTTYGVHNDYTVAGAPRRIEQMTRELGVNDTLRARAGGNAAPPIAPSELERLLRGRWLFINVWRNVASTPVERTPLALCDAATTRTDDLVTFEIRYADRVGENYMAAARPERHAWYYFPRVTRDEAILIKCWDSRGAAFLGRVEADRGYDAPDPQRTRTVPATFSLHTAFEDPNTREGAPERESIEVRTVAFFEE